MDLLPIDYGWWLLVYWLVGVVTGAALGAAIAWARATRHLMDALAALAPISHAEAPQTPDRTASGIIIPLWPRSGLYDDLVGSDEPDPGEDRPR